MLSAHYQLQEGRGATLALPPSAAAPGSAADAEDGDSTSDPATAVAATEGDGGSGLGSAALLSRSAALSQAALLPEDAPVRTQEIEATTVQCGVGASHIEMLSTFTSTGLFLRQQLAESIDKKTCLC